MSRYKVLLFYKYVNVEDPEGIVNEHLQWCLTNEIKGRVFFHRRVLTEPYPVLWKILKITNRI